MQYRRREVIARLRTESNKRKITIDVDPKWTHTKTQLALFARNADSRYGDYWLGYRISSKLPFEKYIRDMLRPSVATPRLDNAHPQNIKLKLINSNIMNHVHYYILYITKKAPDLFGPSVPATTRLAIPGLCDIRRLCTTDSKHLFLEKCRHLTSCAS